MTDINLAASNAQAKSFDKSVSINAGVVVAIILLFLTVAIYGFLYFYNKSLKDKITLAESEYAAEIKKLTSENNVNVFDFQNRIGMAKKSILETSVPLEVLGKVEQDVLPDVYLNSLSYTETDRVLTFACVTSGFNTFAKQIASFKGDAYFSEVSTSGATLGQDGKWGANIKLKIK